MRKKVQIRMISESNDATNVWIQHLINRIVVEQLNLPHCLQGKAAL